VGFPDRKSAITADIAATPCVVVPHPQIRGTPESCGHSSIGAAPMVEEFGAELAAEAQSVANMIIGAPPRFARLFAACSCSSGLRCLCQSLLERPRGCGRGQSGAGIARYSLLDGAARYPARGELGRVHP